VDEDPVWKKPVKLEEEEEQLVKNKKYQYYTLVYLRIWILL
jgi:hypothetical protein